MQCRSSAFHRYSNSLVEWWVPPHRIATTPACILHLMAIPRLGRVSSSLLKASISSLEGNEYGRSVLLESSIKARASSSFGALGQQSAGWTEEGVRSNSAGAAGAAVIVGQGDQSTIRDLISHGSFGASFWRFLAVFPTAAANEIGSSRRRFSTSRPLTAGGSAMKVKSLDHVVLTVKDIEATCQFYSEVLGMEVVKFGASDGGTRVALAFGEQKINLHQVGKEFEPKAHLATAGSADLCFITDTPLDVMQKHIENSGVSILQGPVGRAGALGAIRSVYFRDPDLNLIEVSNYL